jgi:hypothetical protein
MFKSFTENISSPQFKIAITQKTIFEISTPQFKTAITQKYSELSYLRDIICKIMTISILQRNNFKLYYSPLEVVYFILEPVVSYLELLKY